MSEKELIERLLDNRVTGWELGALAVEAADTIARLTAERDHANGCAMRALMDRGIAPAFFQSEVDKARREALEEAARMLDAEHEQSKHMHNYAACYARAIREAMEKP